MIVFKKNSITLLTTLSILITYSQPTQRLETFRHFTVQDGLVQNEITCLFEDSKGYLWIGTKNGVSKYNGKAFENFLVSEGLPAGFVSHISEDTLGNIWIANYNWLTRYDGISFKSYPFPGKRIKNPKILVLDSTHIWLRGHFNGKTRLCFFDGAQFRETDTLIPAFQHYLAPWLVYDRQTRTFLVALNDEKGAASIGRLQGTKLEIIHRFDTTYRNVEVEKWQDYIFASVYREEREKGRSSTFSFQIKEKRLIPSFSFTKDVYTTIKRWYLPDTIYQVDFFKDNFFLDFPNKGIYIVPKGTNEIKKIGTHPSINRMSQVFQTKNQTIWVTTERGLRKYQTDSDLSNPFKYIPEAKLPYVWCLIEVPQGFMWAGSYYEQLKQFNLERNISSLQIFEKNTQGIYYHPILDKRGNIHFPMDRKILTIHPDTELSNIKPVETLRKNDEGGSTSSLYLHYDRKRDHILSGDWHGVTVYDAHHMDPIYKYKYDPKNQTNGLHYHSFIVAIAQDSSDYYWFGSYYGLSRVIPESDSIKNFTFENGQLPSEGAPSIVVDPWGTVWLGSLSGLLYYDEHADRIKPIGQEVIGGRIEALAVGDSNRLYIGAGNELKILDLKAFHEQGKNIIHTFGPNQGMHAELDQNGLFVDSKGIVWATSTSGSGVMYFHPDELQYDNTQCKLVIRKVNNKKLTFSAERSAYPLGDRVNQVFVEVEMVGENYPANPMYQFRFNGEGQDTSWSEAKSSPHFLWQDLGSGTYTLEVRAFQSNGGLLDQQNWASQAIRIDLPVFQEPWFYHRVSLWILLMLLFLAGIFLSVNALYAQRSRLLRQNARKAEDRSRLLHYQAIQSQLDGHFVSNAIGVMEKRIGEPEELMRDTIRDLQELFRVQMETSIHGGPAGVSEQLTTVRLDKLVDFWRLYLQFAQEIEEYKFNYVIHTDGVDLKKHRIPTLMVQPMLENAIKHGAIPKSIADGEEPGKISLSFQESDTHLYIKLRDNGPGLSSKKSQGKKRESRSIDLIHERIAILNIPYRYIDFAVKNHPEGGVQVSYAFED